MTRARKAIGGVVEDERIGRFRTVIAAATTPATTALAVAALRMALAGGTHEVEPARNAREADLECGDTERDERLRVVATVRDERARNYAIHRSKWSLRARQSGMRVVKSA